MEPVRKILGGVVQIAMEINELRDERGTGHGRAEAPVPLTSRHGRLAAGAAVLVATLMFDTLDDENCALASSDHRARPCDSDLIEPIRQRPTGGASPSIRRADSAY